MTPRQRSLIDWKNEDELREQITILKCSKAEDREELIAYCESRLDSLNVGEALVEMSEGDK